MIYCNRLCFLLGPFSDFGKREQIRGGGDRKGEDFRGLSWAKLEQGKVRQATGNQQNYPVVKDETDVTGLRLLLAASGET